MIKIALIGDCCVDVYPQEKKFYLGGMAFNKAKWLARNGTEVTLVSAIGTDDWGKTYLKACQDLKINTDCLKILPGKTSHVEITLDKNQSPVFSAWQLGILKKFKPKFLPDHQDAIIVTALKPIKALIPTTQGLFRVIDFDGTTPYTFPNSQIKNYIHHYDLIVKSTHLDLKIIRGKMTLLTMGGKGSRLITPEKEYVCPVNEIVSGDTTGAGDVYISSFVLNYLKTKNIPLSMKLATLAAAKAISTPRN
jgi:fructoselysine 6-kinase